ncbi:putative B3 domain-containing protein Os10g0537100 [Telopea speciosissima]|uniref:putative B3 domain-containing protein Os10g0537100 n=1 Tax=Telopea speciosissima TaxID=54955 RepID=UPI001CC7964B|nr:putative B3 domain-containing protein Os10g0537100 [Telopea speciosissima]
MMDPAPKIPSSAAYKRLVPQHTSLWGAQFYENNPVHHPHWLRTTSLETDQNKEAATTNIAVAAAAEMFRAPHGTLNFHSYQEDTNTYDDEDPPDEPIVEERDNIEAGYRDDHHQQQQEQEQEQEQEREHMFEKPLTPSDVGKLNRLVIPKQHAERYFPLGGGGGGGESGGEKGLLLSFEDESGKAWRFRYSYWNSSQSYVLTKGWSRFVKEKRLDAGDVVLFERHRVNGERFYIRWRRRAAPVQDSGTLPLPPQHEGPSLMGAWTRVLYSGPAPPPPPLPSPSPSPYHHSHHHYHHHPSHFHGHHGHTHGSPSPILYQADFLHADIATTRAPVVQNPTAPGNWKRLRLFGVNLDCQMLDDAPHPYPSPMPDDDGSSQSSHHHLYPTLLQPPQSAHHGSSIFVTAHKVLTSTTSGLATFLFILILFFECCLLSF